MNFMGGPLSYETVVTQTPAFNSTVYVGNLVPYCTQADLIPLFQSIGYLSEIRMQADRGFAFVKLDTHENAAMAIVQLQGQLVHGRPIKCSWGKDRADGGGASGGAPLGGAPAAAPYGNMQPMYGMPQPNQYAQFGYAYPGFPAGGQQQPGATPTGATPGATDAAQGQQQQQGQWPQQDQNAYAAAYAAQGQQPYWGYYGQQPAADGQQQSS